MLLSQTLVLVTRTDIETFLQNGINTAQNRFEIPNHGYSSGEIIKYSTTSSGIVGISTSEEYYVVKVDDDSFSLSLVGSGNTDKKYYYDRDILVDITTVGNGSFNYLPIEFKINGPIGINTVAGQDFQLRSNHCSEVLSILLT